MRQSPRPANTTSPARADAGAIGQDRRDARAPDRITPGRHQRLSGDDAHGFGRRARRGPDGKSCIGRVTDVVEHLFTYDAESGQIAWKSVVGPRGRVGDEAGWLHKRWGYRVVEWRENGMRKRTYAHRLAWRLYYGSWPPDGMQIDHINCDRLDNRIANLRLATPQQNRMNERPRGDLPKGVSLYRQNGYEYWRARIKLGGKQQSLGYYKTVEEAKAAYDAAAPKMFGEYARLGG